MTDLARPTAAVEIQRTLSATMDEIFDAWTDPALMAQWLSPIGEAEAVVDLRPGGAFRVVMRGGGVEIEHSGEYLTVERPDRLVFTWRSKFTGGAPTRVTVELAPGESGTTLRLRHELLTPDAVESHGGGWQLMLDRLAALLAAP
jgi:uncharacterized protein YndB with AHSA1/START domain